MKFSDKIGSNILTNRLELLINHGLLEVTKLPNDNKTKIYHLTNKGIDLYPIMFEMMCWSKRNLDKGFGPIGDELFKDIQRISSEKFIKNTQSTYVKYRDHILSV